MPEIQHTGYYLIDSIIYYLHWLAIELFVEHEIFSESITTIDPASFRYNRDLSEFLLSHTF